MIFSRHTLVIIVLALLIALDSMALAWAIQQESMVITTLNLMIAWGLFTGFLVWHTLKVNRDLARFFQAFRHGDPSLLFSTKGKDPVYHDLHEEMNSVMDEFRKVEQEREKNYLFFQRVMEHLQVGLTAFDENGVILLKNKSLMEIFNLRYFKDITELQNAADHLPFQLMSMKNGEKRIFKINKNFEEQQLVALASLFVLAGKTIRVVSFQNIKGEIDATESNTWQKMIRILTHEIINSMSPIRLTAASMLQEINNKGENFKDTGIGAGIVDEFKLGLQAIRKRSNHLTSFIEEYRKIVQIPTPNPVFFKVLPFIHEILQLFKSETEKKDIGIMVEVQPDRLGIFADEKQLSQVMVNVLRNCFQAMEERKAGSIEISARKIKTGTVITIKDNGIGIEKDILSNIFTPFFSTKNGGTGIGLSICKQIMKMNKGDIHVESKPGSGTLVILKFKG